MIKFIPILIILSNILFSFELLEDSMGINYSPLSVQSSAMGSVYMPNGDIRCLDKHKINNRLIFSHLSKFENLYILDIIQFNYKGNSIIFASNGVNDIVDTKNAWMNIDNNEPEANKIDYSKIEYFDIKDFNLILSREIKNKYRLSIKNTLSKNYSEYGLGLGLNIVTNEKKIGVFSYFVGVYDMVSLKYWSTSRLEYYKPKGMFSLEIPIFRTLNIITMYIDDQSIDYRMGSKINISSNLDIYIGHSVLDKFSLGFSMANELFNIDYSYIVSNINIPNNGSHNIGLGINITKLNQKSKNLYP